MRKAKLFILISLLASCFTKSYAQTDSFQVYPNPFSSVAYFHFYLVHADTISIDLYNLLGQKIGTDYQDTFFTSGAHTVSFDGNNLKNGVYLIKFVIGKSNNITTKIVKAEPTSEIHKKTLFKNDVLVYPNPTNGNLNIKINDRHTKSFTLNIYDNTGRQVFSNNYNGASIEFSMSDFKDGVYTISIPSLNYNYKLILIK